MIRSQITPNAVVAKNPDFAALAHAYGAGFIQPSNLGDIPAAIQTALAAAGPTVIRLTPDLTS